MNDNYPKAYKEVYEILQYIPAEDLRKIPTDIIKTIEKNMDKEYTYVVQQDIDFEMQPMLEETKAILGILYRDYWADSMQREKIIKKQRYDIQKEEEKKIQQYQEMIKNKNKNQLNNKEKQNLEKNIKQEQALDKCPKEVWYMKILKFIKTLILSNKNKE